MKRFFLFSVSVMFLAVAALIGFYIGSNKAEAQSSEVTVVGYEIFQRADGLLDHYVLLSSGSVYFHTAEEYGGAGSGFIHEDPVWLANYWGSVVPTSQSTWGDIKKLKK